MSAPAPTYHPCGLRPSLAIEKEAILQVLTKPRPQARRLAFALVSALTLVLAGGASSGAATTTVVRLTFDNNTISQYTLGYAQALQPHGARGTFFINSGTVGSSKSSSRGRSSALAAAGNEIGGKTVDGINLKTTTDIQTKIDEVCNDRAAIIPHGLGNPTSFAYPFGAFDRPRRTSSATAATATRAPAAASRRQARSTPRRCRPRRRTTSPPAPTRPTVQVTLANLRPS